MKRHGRNPRPSGRGGRQRSKVDNERCYALFEGRYELRPTAEPVSLTERVDWVERICREMGLQLDR
jgi:hypothetical protein